MIADARGPWGPLAEPYHTDKRLPPNAPPWRENVFLAFFDRERKVYGTSHFTGSLNAGGRRARFSVMVGGHLAELVEPMEIGELGTAGIQLDLASNVRAKGNGIDAELNLVPRHPTVDYSASKALPGLSDAEPLRHYQRSGTFSGTVALGGTSVQVSGGCVRDRTWGYREESQLWAEYYACFFSFGEFDLTMMKFSVIDKGSQGHGFLVGGRDGHITGSRVKRNGWGSITQLDVDVAGESPIELAVGPAEARIFCPMGEPDGATAISVYDEFVEATTSEGLTGFGIIEQGILRRLD